MFNLNMCLFMRHFAWCVFVRILYYIYSSKTKKDIPQDIHKPYFYITYPFCCKESYHHPWCCF